MSPDDGPPRPLLDEEWTGPQTRYRCTPARRKFNSDGNDGGVAGKQFSGESAGALRGVFDTVGSMLGLSIPGLIQGRVTGAAQGESFGTALREQQECPKGESSGRRAATALVGDTQAGPKQGRAAEARRRALPARGAHSQPRNPRCIA